MSITFFSQHLLINSKFERAIKYIKDENLKGLKGKWNNKKGFYPPKCSRKDRKNPNMKRYIQQQQQGVRYRIDEPLLDKATILHKGYNNFNLIHHAVASGNVQIMKLLINMTDPKYLLTVARYDIWIGGLDFMERETTPIVMCLYHIDYSDIHKELFKYMISKLNNKQLIEACDRSFPQIVSNIDVFKLLLDRHALYPYISCKLKKRFYSGDIIKVFTKSMYGLDMPGYNESKKEYEQYLCEI